MNKDENTLITCYTQEQDLTYQLRDRSEGIINIKFSVELSPTSIHRVPLNHYLATNQVYKTLSKRTAVWTSLSIDFRKYVTYMYIPLPKFLVIRAGVSLHT